jgi:hypothetical protein
MQDYRFVVPKILYERLRKLAIRRAEWDQALGVRPRTRSSYLREALEDLLQKYCV